MRRNPYIKLAALAVTGLLGLLAANSPKMAAAGRSTVGMARAKAAPCPAPRITGFKTSNNPAYDLALGWVQQFTLKFDVNFEPGFATIYDSDGAASAVFGGGVFSSPNGAVGNRGTRLWVAGKTRTEYALVSTPCGTAKAKLKFRYQPRAAGPKWKQSQVYVALGDSFSSGEGNPPFMRGACHVSPAAWPDLLFQGWSNPSPYMEADVACSGARIDDLFRPFKGQPSQLEQLKALKPDFATVTIGGNDLGYGKMLFECYSWNCLSDSQFQAAKQDITNLESRLEDAFRRITAAVPQLFVVGYPYLFPRYQYQTKGCGWLTPTERTRLNELTAQLDSVEKQAAEAVGAQYISVLSALDGMELCSDGSEVFKLTPACVHDSRCGHPLVNGQNAIATAVNGGVWVTP